VAVSTAHAHPIQRQLAGPVLKRHFGNVAGGRSQVQQFTRQVQVILEQLHRHAVTLHNMRNRWLAFAFPFPLTGWLTRVHILFLFLLLLRIGSSFIIVVIMSRIDHVLTKNVDYIFLTAHQAPGRFGARIARGGRGRFETVFFGVEKCTGMNGGQRVPTVVLTVTVMSIGTEFSTRNQYGDAMAVVRGFAGSSILILILLLLLLQWWTSTPTSLFRTIRRRRRSRRRCSRCRCSSSCRRRMLILTVTGTTLTTLTTINVANALGMIVLNLNIFFSVFTAGTTDVAVVVVLFVVAVVIVGLFLGAYRDATRIRTRR
jgi:hypothetical protein